jgi:hypothetical protein
MVVMAENASHGMRLSGRDRYEGVEAAPNRAVRGNNRGHLRDCIQVMPI